MESGVRIRGHFHLDLYDRHGRLIEVVDDPNVILDVGLVAIAMSMSLPSSERTLYAIQIGDNGATADPTVPKVVDPIITTAMFHELGDRTNVGFTAVDTDNAILCQQQFESGDYDDADFLDSGLKYLNEAMLFLGKVGDGVGDWQAFAMRTYKSVPFAPADTLTANIKWTIYFERG